MILRPYQTAMMERAREALRTNKAIILQLPTGGGKTPTACAIIAKSVARNKKVLFLAHRQELLTQASHKLTAFGIPHGLIRAGKPMSLSQPVQVASVQTLVRRLKDIRFMPNLICIDEGHLSIAPTYQKIIEAFPHAFILSLTATPGRLDGKGLGRDWGGFYDAIVCGPSVQELTDEHYLVPIRTFVAQNQIDVSKLATIGGDYNPHQLAATVDKPKITGDVITHWQRIANGRLTLAFGVSLEHCEHIAAQFRAAGIEAISVNGSWSEETRAGAMRDFEAGKIQVLVNCHLYIEGLDIPAVSCIVNMAPTASLTRYLQKVGRGSRPFDGKQDCIFLDHAGDVYRHNHPAMARAWTLEGRTKRSKKPTVLSPRICPQCWAAMPSGAVECGECHYTWPVESRTVEQIEGELVEWVSPKTVKPERIEEWNCNTLADWQALGAARGYHKNWAERRYEYRKARVGAVSEQRELPHVLSPAPVDHSQAGAE